MKLMVAIEHHFVRCPEGVFTDLAFGYDYWQEYLEVFDEVTVMARVQYATERPKGLQRADGKGVKFSDISNYYGVKSFILRFPLVFWQAGKAIGQADRYLLRSGNIGSLAWVWLMLKRKKYARECTGHMKEGIATEKPATFLYKVIAEVSHRLCKIQMRHAVYASYTSEFLRRCYPCRNHDTEFVFSGVRLTDEVVASARQEKFFRNKPFRFVSIGRVERQKGHIWLVNAAIELAKRKGLPDWTLDIVGPGSQIVALRKYVEEFGVADKVKVVDSVPWGDELFSYMDESHLFILPSLTESMPRSLIEAMARGMPAIGANTGGIPELLAKQDLVAVGDVTGLADSMAKRMTEPNRLVEMSARNFKRAQDFRVKVTKAKKIAFWQCILNCSGNQVKIL